MKGPRPWLDHVGLTGPDIETMRATFDRLGFASTKAHELMRRDAASGELASLDQTSAHIVLKTGYIELSRVGRREVAHHLSAYAGRYDGPHILALGCPDAATVHRQAIEQGLPVTPVAEAARDVDYGQRAGRARFRWFMVEATAAPEALLCVTESLTPEIVHQEEVERHPNGAEALIGCTLVAHEPADTLARLERLTGRRANVAEGMLRLGPGSISVKRPDEFSRRFPGGSMPPAPSLAAMSIRVANVPVTRALLHARRIKTHGDTQRVWIDAADACGAVIEFV